MKNLLIVHMESITRERLATFASSFPHTLRLMQDAVVFDRFFSSATSTLMVVTYLFHGNDFEFDTASRFEGMRPAANNPHLFSILRDHGYAPHLVCLNAFETFAATRLASWPDDLPPAFGTNDFPTLQARFDEITDAEPFAVYVWDLITHIEHSLALAPFASGLTDQVARACRVADAAVATMLATLERKGKLADTMIVLYGDHGDDYWTHGFKAGMVHATEPYTQITWAPLAIAGAGLTPGLRGDLVTTIDIAPTCLALLGIDERLPFEHSGHDALASPRSVAFSQNFTASQPDDAVLGIARAFAATDDTYNLLASSRGLELYAYRLDPGNHCNLLGFFDAAPDGTLQLRQGLATASHFRAALPDNPRAIAHIGAGFHALRTALGAHVAAKHAYVEAGGASTAQALDPRVFDVFARTGSPLPERIEVPRSALQPQMVPFEFTFKLPP
ncbi:MAG: sulfatase-like hydrolase/transferase [Casimicrobiaceae bacterium]